MFMHCIVSSAKNSGKVKQIFDYLMNQLAERKRPVKVLVDPSGNSSLHPPVRCRLKSCSGVYSLIGQNSHPSFSYTNKGDHVGSSATALVEKDGDLCRRCCHTALHKVVARRPEIKTFKCCAYTCNY